MEKKSTEQLSKTKNFKVLSADIGLSISTIKRHLPKEFKESIKLKKWSNYLTPIQYDAIKKELGFL